MLPDLTVLLALLLGIVMLDGTPSDPVRALLGSLLCLLVGGAMSRLSLGRGLGALEEDDELLAETSLRWASFWPFMSWMGALTFFEWGAWVNASVPRTWWITRYVVLLLPALVAFSVGWMSRAQLELALARRRGLIAPVRTPWGGVLRGLRRNSVVLIPLLAVLGLSEAIWLGGQLGIGPLRTLSLWSEATELVDIGLTFGLVALALPFLPLIFVKALRAQPLAPGALRSRLEEAARRIGLRYRDICVWRTGGRIFNAMVVGFTPRTRVIFLTDGLLATMPEDEVLAVFFHEAGHAKRHHMLQFLLLFFAVALLFHVSRELMVDMGIPPVMQLMLQLAAIWFVILGSVSRRFERDSDIYGAEHAAMFEPDAPPLPLPGLPAALPRGAALMIRALERIRAIVGSQGGHRHGSIEDRITYIAHHAVDPGMRLAHARARRTLTLGILACLAVTLVAVLLRLPLERAHISSHVLSTEALGTYHRAWDLEHAPDSAQAAGARAAWQEAFDGFEGAARALDGQDDLPSRAGRIQALFNAGETALHGLRDAARARPLFEEVLANLKQLGQGGPTWALLRFQAHVELGRICAWQAVAEPGERGPDFALTLDHLEQARALRRADLGPDAELPADARELLDERLRLLQATYDAARGETELARRALEQLAQLAGPDPRAYGDRQELAEDAQEELRRLRAR